MLKVGRSVPARCCTHRHRVWFLCCLTSQVACDFTLRRHWCLCFSPGMVRVSIVGLRTPQIGTTPEGLTRCESYTPLSSAKFPQIMSLRDDILVCFFRGETKLRCIQKDVHRVLVVRAMRVGRSVTAVLSRRRSVLRPASSEVLSRGILKTFARA